MAEQKVCADCGKAKLLTFTLLDGTKLCTDCRTGRIGRRRSKKPDARSRG